MRSLVYYGVLLVLISQCVYITAQTCGGNGNFQNSTCVCYSGFAPSDSSAQDCDDSVPGTCTWANSTSTFTGGASSINATGTFFLGNNLSLSIQSPVTVDRTITEISIGGSTNVACIYPGGDFFHKTLQGCDDTFLGNIPWSNNAECDFVSDNSDPTFLTYSAPIYVTSYEVTTIRGTPFTQTQTDVLHIIVQFQKQISISMDTTVVAPVNMFSAVTNQAFDPTTNLGTVAFVTSLEWPFKLTSGSVTTEPAGLSISGGALAETTSSGDCSAAGNSTCFQEFNFQIVPGSVCQLTGSYVIDYTITCRGADPCPLDPATNSAVLTLHLVSSDFCAAVQTGITATAQLTSYEESAHTNSKATFLIGQSAYFLVQVSSTEAGISATEISTISVSTGGSPTTLYTFGGGSSNAALTAVANFASTASFAVDFTSALFDVPTDQQLQYSFVVDIGVTFDGNTKRMVRASVTPPTAQTHASSNVLLQNTASGSSQDGDASDATRATATFFLLGSLLLLCML